MNLILIYLGKILSKLINLLSLGSGATWPGHIALNLNPNFIKENIRNSKAKIILVAGTNGKTTTSSLIQSILLENGKTVFRNTSGANLLNGIASSIVLNSNVLGKLDHDYAIFEVDENTLPLTLKEFTPDYLVLLNLFRDQLDRYGEINTISLKWKNAISSLPKSTKLVLNANDPQIAFLGVERNSLYFGLNEKGAKSIPSSADSVFCPNCNSALNFSDVYFSHIGKFKCSKCSYKTPQLNISEAPYYPVTGSYNKFNILAAVLVSQDLGFSEQEIKNGLVNFKPAFGRQEEILKNGKKVKIFLSKNPTSLNESLRTIRNAKTLLLVLNDRIPDGRDVSWIWDVDFENLLKSYKVIISGDRAYDLGIRLKYADFNKVRVIESLSNAVRFALRETKEKETLHILPTYSAMLEVRKILTGRKIQ
jgi:lipid II isoglutaminyl synthase (glutamine-hydrolysing)